MEGAGMKSYRRVPLCVEALFSVEGTLIPKKLYFRDNAYEIEQIITVRHHCPQIVPCIAPLEYTVSIDGIHKKLYYEADTASWFSIKEYYK